MKNVVQVVLLALSAFFCYMIYKSIMGPLEFKELKQKRYTEVVKRLKNIRDAQEAYRTVKGEYATSFPELVDFVETGKFTITSQRDTSWVEFNKIYRIDELKQDKVIDTLGFVSVKDSLFKDSDDYKNMMFVPFAEDSNTKFEMKAGKLDKNGYKAPVFEVKVKKNIVLWDQPKDLLDQENKVKNVEDINGDEIRVGSMEEISTTGNWPTLYDAKSKR